MNKPDDLVLLARIGEPYGVSGWMNVLTETEDPQVLRKAKQWWVSRLPEGNSKGPRSPGKIDEKLLTFEPFRVLQVKPHSDRLVAHLEGIEDRELAKKFKGCRVYVPRSRFPAPAENEFYWVDLVGCEVSNLQSVPLGQVKEVMDHGAHAILVVTRSNRKEDLLIPFVETYVPEVNLAERTILVDWQEDYL